MVATCFVLGALTLGTPPSAEAHLANFGSWEITRGYLQEIFPDATDFLRRRDTYSEAQVRQIEAELGFELYPEDRNPEFYIAVDESGGKRRFLGVAIFIDPRVESRLLEGNVVRIEVGIGVDARGRVKRVRLFDYRGDRALTRGEFLDQLVGLSLDDSFDVGPDKSIKPVANEPVESQLVANAAREALYLMKVSLGQGG
ncbi:hypothetical protein DL240_12095 [Lujinxingia litoralis]|uniref:FMN-binding domain-containing protein n=2 Tax=Lujinxingia litoralis TaxID=2211119 RepID=A0A328C5L2_9DELT|nr:hypothetical protein DL240_12095 [Lujinxingia litoralis]